MTINPGQPKEIFFCKKCVESNQRFVSSVQHKITPNEKKETAMFDNEGVCLACRYYEKKKTTDWNLKEKELIELLDRHRKKDGSYDVLVPGSGGKDSMAALNFLLKGKRKVTLAYFNHETIHGHQAEAGMD